MYGRVAEALLIPSGGQAAHPYSSRHSLASGSVTAAGSRGSVTGFAGGVAALAFTRSGLGTTTGIVDTVLGTTAIGYTYDAVYRLTRADYADGSYFHYEYDAVGNRTSEVACWGGASCTPITTTYAYDDANRLTSVDEQPYTWDANGNPSASSGQALLADGTFTYTYDAANRLITATSGITTSGYVYNGLGDRVKQSVNGVAVTYTLDLAARLTQVLADGAYTYLYGQGRIAQFDGSDFDYFLGDALGSLRQLADEGGEVTLAQSYEPYGQVLDSVGTGETSYDFTGEARDAVTGLIYLRARFMVPSLGRFIQRDSWPGGYIKLPYPGASYEAPDTSRFVASDWPSDYTRPQSLNRWAYVEGDPINRVDPSGRFYCQEPLDPLNRRCEQWILDALETLENHGAVGQFVATSFRVWDRALYEVQVMVGCTYLPAWLSAPGLRIYFVPGLGNAAPPGLPGSQVIGLQSDWLDHNPITSAYALGVFAHEVVHATVQSNEARLSIAGEVYAYQAQARVVVENGGIIVAGDLLDEMSRIDIYSQASLIHAQEFLVDYWDQTLGEVVYSTDKLAPDGWPLKP